MQCREEEKGDGRHRGVASYLPALEPAATYMSLLGCIAIMIIARARALYKLELWALRS